MTKSHHGVSCVVRLLSRVWGGQAPGIHSRRDIGGGDGGQSSRFPWGWAEQLHLATTRHFSCLVKQQTPQNRHCCTHKHHGLTGVHSLTHSSGALNTNTARGVYKCAQSDTQPLVEAPFGFWRWLQRPSCAPSVRRSRYLVTTNHDHETHA